MVPHLNLEPLLRCGYTACEAVWLHRVMSCAGVFLRRQFRTHANSGKAGGHDHRLVDKLIRSGHAAVLPYHGREQLCHVRARRLYAAVGCEHSRLRRALPPLLATQRLLVLDFIAVEPGEYLATEDEKVRYFVQRGFTHDQLPHRVYESPSDAGRTTTHYFIDRYPICVDAKGRVCFVVPDLVPRLAAALRAFLVEYRPLLDVLPAAEIVYVTGRNEDAGAACRLFHEAHGASTRDLNLADVEALDAYFTTRRALDDRAYGRLSQAALDRYPDDARRFTGPAYDDLYHHWRRGGVVALTHALRGRPSAAPHITFRHVSLPWRYYCLGVRADLAARPRRAQRGQP